MSPDDPHEPSPSGPLARWMPHSLRGQFSAALGVMGLMVLLGGVTAIYALHHTADAARQVSQERLSLVEAAQELQQHAQQIELLSDRIVTAQALDEARRQYDRILVELDDLDRLTARLAVSDDASVLDLHMASQLFRNSAHIISHLREDSSLGGSPEMRVAALSSYRDEMQGHAQALTQAAREQSRQLTAAYQDAVQQVVETSRVSARWVMGWLVTCLFGTWLIARHLLGRHVLNRLQQVSQALRHAGGPVVSAGPPMAAVRDDDEIGEMARSVEQFLRDRSQLALTRARLEIEQQRLAAIIDNTADCIMVMQSGGIRQLNRAAEQMFGLKQEQARGLRGDELLLGVDWKASTLPGVTLDARALGRDGHTIPVEVSISPVASGGDLLVLVIRDATLRKEAEQHLIAARDAAEAARAAQASFLATMSHELRTPLNAVLGYAQLLELDASLNERQLFAAGTIRRSGEHLLALINDLLDLAKHDAGKLELCLADTALRDTLRLTSDIIRVKAEEAGLQFRTELADDVPTRVQVDDKRLRQVLLNLLSNAVKFTDQGEVLLAVTRLPSAIRQHVTLRFEVRDSGVGMQKEQLDKIFLPFEQAGDVRRRAVGTGLGLAISRQLVRMMGGDIQVHSQPGEGTVFWFELTVRELGGASLAPGAGRIAGYAGEPRRILIVDDLPANRLVLREWLAPLGFDLDEAGDGHEAVERAVAHTPDLVIMDLSMPGQGGEAAMAQIHQIEPLRSVPIIAVSAALDEAFAPVGEGQDASVFLPKPVDRDRLLLELGRLLGLSWEREAAAVVESAG
ncbi:ATP-binding protein [Ideonella sp. DXS29W]|uniref:histidine kinase n=1 Tax=Ideonella lacteola TaxID=2984193 RepID=A0ABU9BMR8_9BURK